MKAKLVAFYASILLTVTPVTSANPAGCYLPSDEKLVCAMVMCDFGKIYGEWSQECRSYEVEFAHYLATLGFWDKPPKCEMRDDSCAKNGRAQKVSVSPSTCNNLGTDAEQKSCLDGIALYENDGGQPTLSLCNGLNNMGMRETCCMSLTNGDDREACRTNLESDRTW